VIGDSKKHDGGKLRYDLIEPVMIEELCKVITYGANKYEDNGWKQVESERYVAALFRHLLAWRKGETHDDESGMKHLSHALTNIAFLIYLEEQNENTNTIHLKESIEQWASLRSRKNAGL
jgi:hypothetical protein